MSNLRVLTQAWTHYAMDHEGEMVSSATFQYGWVNSGNTDDDIKSGELYQYVPSVDVFKCPSDAARLVDRTYSINCVLNSENWGHVPYRHITQVPSSSDTFCFIEEYDPRGYNGGGFALEKPSDRFIDFPAHYHGDGSTITFVDGHAEYWVWTDPRTLAITTFYTPSPNNADLKRLQSVAGY